MTWLTLALVLSLAWTSPSVRAIGPFDCTPSTVAIAVPETCIVFMATQSRTWVGFHALMEWRPVYWSLFWPRVHAEAEPVNVGSVVAQPGTPCSLSVPDSAGVFFYVRSTTGGQMSCPSNEVWR